MVRQLVPGMKGFDREREPAWRGRTRRVTARASTHGAFGGASLGARSRRRKHAIYNQMHAQAATLAYVDIIRDLTIFCACMLPLLFFIPKAPKNMSVGH